MGAIVKTVGIRAEIAIVPRILSAAIPSALFRKTETVKMEISAVMSFKAMPLPLLSLNEQLDITKEGTPEKVKTKRETCFILHFFEFISLES